MNRKDHTGLKRVFNLVEIVAGLVVLMAFVLFLNALFASHNSTTVNELLNPASQLPATWQEYADTERGFSILYPPDWKFSQSESPSIGRLELSWLDPIAQRQPPDFTEIQQGAVIFLIIKNYSSTQSLQDYLNTQRTVVEEQGLATRTEVYESVIEMRGSIQGIRQTLSSGDSKTEAFSFVQNVKEKPLLFSMSIVMPRSSEISPEQEKSCLEIFNQMLTSLHLNK